MEYILNKQFLSICKWLIDNKLLFHFREDKNKPILSSEMIYLHKYINKYIYIHKYIYIYLFFLGEGVPLSSAKQ